MQLELISSLKSPKEVAKITDIDWSGSDRPVIATADGCIIVCDILLKLTHCKIEDIDLPGSCCRFSNYCCVFVLMKNVTNYKVWLV